MQTKDKFSWIIRTHFVVNFRPSLVLHHNRTVCKVRFCHVNETAWKCVTAFKEIRTVNETGDKDPGWGKWRSLYVVKWFKEKEVRKKCNFKFQLVLSSSYGCHLCAANSGSLWNQNLINYFRDVYHFKVEFNYFCFWVSELSEGCRNTGTRSKHVLLSFLPSCATLSDRSSDIRTVGSN